jgi:hypothetical protein
MKFLWYNQTIVKEFLKAKRNDRTITDHDLGSGDYKKLHNLNRCFSSDPWGVQQDITGHVQHHFNIVTKNPYVYQSNTQTFEQVCMAAADKISRLTDRPIAMLWSGGIDSTSALVSLLKTMPSDRITVVCNHVSISEYTSFYNDIIKDRLNVLSLNEWLLSKDKYFTVSGCGGDCVWGVIDQSSWKNNSDNFNKPWKQSLNKDIAPDFEFIEEFCSWSGVDIKTWLDLRTWFYICCKWQDKCLWSYTMRADLAADDMCAFYDVDNSFQTWSLNNLDKIIGNSWHQYKVPAKQMIHQYHADSNYLQFKSKEDTGELSTVLKNFDILKQNPAKIVIFEDYSTCHLPSWPFLDMFEFEKFNNEFELIPHDVLHS